jgi:DNA-binding response OmpR family regulator
MRTILVIDDDVIILQTLCMVLNAQGYHAIGAENPRQAQQQFDSNTVDLIIVDHGLPGITGSDLAKQFRDTKPVLALMLSGSAELVGTPEGMDLLLPKPCSIPNLLTAIDALFQCEARFAEIGQQP